MNVRARLGGGFAQARQGALLAVHVGGKFRVRQHKRELSGEIRAAKRAYRGLDILRHRRDSMIRKCFAIKFDYFCWRGEAAGDLLMASTRSESPCFPL